VRSITHSSLDCAEPPGGGGAEAAQREKKKPGGCLIPLVSRVIPCGAWVGPGLLISGGREPLATRATPYTRSSSSRATSGAMRYAPSVFVAHPRSSPSLAQAQAPRRPPPAGAPPRGMRSAQQAAQAAMRMRFRTVSKSGKRGGGGLFFLIPERQWRAAPSSGWGAGAGAWAGRRAPPGSADGGRMKSHVGCRARVHCTPHLATTRPEYLLPLGALVYKAALPASTSRFPRGGGGKWPGVPSPRSGGCPPLRATAPQGRSTRGCFHFI
jgi:hypothetical protein